MDPIPFKQANVTLRAPNSMPDCMELPTYSSQAAGRAPEDGAFYLSKWKLTTAELAVLNETGELWLFVWGASHPPVALSTANPFHPSTEQPEQPE